MEKEKLVDPVETEKQKIKDTVKLLFGSFSCYLAMNETDFPRVCVAASVQLKIAIKKVNNIDVDFCEGSLHFNEDNSTCSKHAWLEHGNMIIDPTDYQFHVIDLNGLPLEPENFIPTDGSLEECQTEDEMHQIMLKTYQQNNHKRYLENPNEKEKRFSVLVEEMRSGSADPELVAQELRESYGSKIFYDKNDKRYEYKVETKNRL